MLKNTSGQECEKQFSLRFHQGAGIPILVSPQVLRSRDLGQLDFSRFDTSKRQVMIVELKNGEWVTGGQKRRLLASGRWLSQVFNAPSLISGFSWKKQKFFAI